MISEAPLETAGGFNDRKALTNVAAAIQAITIKMILRIFPPAGNPLLF